MNIPNNIDLTMRYIPQKATVYVRQKQESCLSEASVSTYIETEWDSIRSNTSSLSSCPISGCLKIKSFEESLKHNYALTSKSTTTKKGVQWSSVDVYLHTFELGDHPCPIMGPPTTISWVAHDHKNLLIDDFEDKRRKQKRDTICPTIREHILINAGYSKKELYRAINEARSVRMSRARSQNDKLRKESSSTKKPLLGWFFARKRASRLWK